MVYNMYLKERSRVTKTIQLLTYEKDGWYRFTEITGQRLSSNPRMERTKVVTC